MLNLPLALRLEKNKLVGTAPWLVLMSLTLPNSMVIRLARNTEDVVFYANTYTAFSFEIGDINSGGDGKVMGVSLKVANPGRALQPYLEANNGLIGCALSLMVVHADNLASDYTDITLAYTVMDAVADEDWINFTLGAENPLRRRFPLQSAIPLSCNWEFKGAECAYAGADTTCARTLLACQAKNNAPRFGGRPGINGAPRFV